MRVRGWNDRAEGLALNYINVVVKWPNVNETICLEGNYKIYIFYRVSRKSGMHVYVSNGVEEDSLN